MKMTLQRQYITVHYLIMYILQYVDTTLALYLVSEYQYFSYILDGPKWYGKYIMFKQAVELTINDIFQYASNSHEYQVCFSAYEILGTKVFDLLKETKEDKLSSLLASPGSPKRNNMTQAVLFDDSETSFRELKQVCKVPVSTKTQTLEYWEKALKQKIYGSHIFVCFYFVVLKGKL